MTSFELLSLIQGLLLAENLIEARIVSTESEQPYRLLVPLNDPESPILLQLLVTDVPEVEQPENTSPSARILYFFAEIPLVESAIGCEQIPFLLALLNPLLPLGSLEISHRSLLYFRYGFLYEENWPDPRSMLEIIMILKEILPRVAHYLQQVFRSPLPISDSHLEHLKQVFRELLSHRAAAGPALPLHPIKTHYSLLLRFSLAYLGMAILALGLGTLATAWRTPVFGLCIGLMLLLPGFATVWFYQQRARHQRYLQKQQQKFRFFLHILETERLRMQSHQEQVEQQRDLLDYALLQLRQIQPETPQQLVRLHQHLKLFLSNQEYLMHQLTDLKKRLQDVALSQDNLLQEINNLPQSQSQPLLTESQEADSSSDPIEALLLKLASLLNYLDFETQVWRATTALPAHLQVCMPHAQILISGYMDWSRTWLDTPAQTWLILFEAPLLVSVPDARLRAVQELLIHFNRYLPVGAAYVDRRRGQVVLRYCFIRLQYDISNFLVIEILEMLDFFAQKLTEKLTYFLEHSPPLEEMLKQLEAEFIALLH